MYIHSAFCYFFQLIFGFVYKVFVEVGNRFAIYLINNLCGSGFWNPTRNWKKRNFIIKGNPFEKNVAAKKHLGKPKWKSAHFKNSWWHRLSSHEFLKWTFLLYSMNNVKFILSFFALEIKSIYILCIPKICVTLQNLFLTHHL